MPTEHPSLLLDVDAAAAYLTVSSSYVRRLIRERRVAFHKIGKFVRLDVRDLDAWLAECRVEVGGRVEQPRPGRRRR